MTTPYEVEAGQKFTVDTFQEADAEGIVNLFRAVYGEHYPIRTYYDPVKIREENAQKNLYSVVARTEKGDIIGHMGFHRSSPYNRNLYEGGIMLVMPSYRRSSAVHKLMTFGVDSYVYTLDVDGIYSETVCYLTVTQKMTQKQKFIETGIEVGLMPASAYASMERATGRVSCVLSFKIFKEEAPPLYLPQRYIANARFMLDGVNPPREILDSDDLPPENSRTGAVCEYFDVVGVLRVNVYSVGRDFAEYAAQAEAAYIARGAEIIQFFVNLQESWAPGAVDSLAERGYYLAAMVPCWFASDGVLMMKNITGEILELRLHSDKADRLLDVIRRQGKVVLPQ